METRELLTDLGETAIRTNGFGGFSYADLAEQAGIRKASIHHHFPAKSDLGLAVLDRYADRLATMLGDFRSTSRHGGQALARTVRLYRDALGDGSTLCLCTALGADTEKLDPAISKKLAQANAMVTDWLAETLLIGRKDRSISVGGNPPEEAAAILAQLQGAQLIARAGSDLSLFDTAMTPLMDRIGKH